jgi:hypothetical protein
MDSNQAIRYANATLAYDWSVDRFVNSVTAKTIPDITRHFGDLEPMAKVRLLIACSLALSKLAGQQDQQQTPNYQFLLDSLQDLANRAHADDEDWVKIMAAAMGHLDGRLRLDAVIKQSSVVRHDLCAAVS